MKNLAILDLETTGTDTSKDRVVEIGVIICSHDLVSVHQRKEVRVNPGVPIPKQASDVHGITDEMVAGLPKFASYAKAFAELLNGCDIVTFNGLSFDIPLLSEEFARCGIAWPIAGTKFIDAFVIYREKERRDLAAAVKFYTGQDHTGAHGAAADCEGTLNVLRGQKSMYGDISNMDVDALHKFCMGNRVDFSGKIVMNEQGVPVYAIGKSKGIAVTADPGFGRWMLGQDFPADTKRVIRQLLGIV